jgi:hypothetical protein
MKSEYTQGPWYLNDQTQSDPHYGQLRVDSTLMGDALAVCGTGRFVDDEARANARIMSAAPDLLAAAERILAAVTEAQGWQNADLDLSHATALKLAVAKAKGEGV